MKEKIKSSPALKVGIAVFLVLILFASGYLTGVLSNININMPLLQKTAATTEASTTTLPSTTEPTTTAPTTTLPSTTKPTTTAPTTTLPSTTAAEDECCLSGICDFLEDTFGSLLSELPDIGLTVFG